MAKTQQKDWDGRARRARHYAVSNRLAEWDNRHLAALLGENRAGGWGATHTIKVDGTPVFIKRIPLTEREHENLFSTANHYNLPTFYNYGVGSAGFGAFRELVAHIKTTNWVLAGEVANFPLMYHYRIVPFAGVRTPVDEERHARYVRYWNSDPNIDRYIRERAAAPYEITLFLEHFPHVLNNWLAKNLDGTETVVWEMRSAIAFLRDHGVIHFDAHFHNVLVDDNGIPYLTDFGLVLDKAFTLDKREQAFFRRHPDYDDAEFLLCLGQHVFSLYRNLPERSRKRVMRRYSIAEEVSYADLVAILLGNLEEIQAGRLLPLHESFVRAVLEHRELVLLMHAFFSGLSGGTKKDTKYPEQEIRRLLSREP